MKKGYIVGLILTILGLFLSQGITIYSTGYTCTYTAPVGGGPTIAGSCTEIRMPTSTTYIVGMFYTIAGIGIGIILTTYMSKYVLTKK